MDKAFLDLLKKWLSGDFRRTDGEQVQSLTDGDDFRREAFEGFSEQSQTVGEKQVSAMRARFEKKYGSKKGGRTVPMNWLLAAAACGILILGTVWLYDKTGQTMGEDANQIAMKKAAQPVESQSLDSFSTATPASQQPILGEKKSGSFSQKEGAPTRGTTQASPTENLIMAETETARPTADEGDQYAKDRAAAIEPEPVAPAKIESRAEDFDNYSRSQNQQNVPRTLPSDQNASGKPMPKKPAAAKPAPATEQLADQSVADPTQKAEKKSKKKAAEEAFPAPADGWKSFKNYLSKNKKLPEAARAAGISGEVLLYFYVDKNGRPVQVLVAKKLGGGCDEEAVRLLENGPDWSPAGCEAKVSIEF